MQWDKGAYGWLFLLMPILVWLLTKYVAWRKNLGENLAESHLLEFVIKNLKNNRVWLKGILMLLAMFFGIIALMDPKFGLEKDRQAKKGIDIVYVLDLSTSMNCQDLAPSRLERAKKIISSSLERLSGNSAGLVVFAANAYHLCPLTSDFSAISLYLESVETSLLSHQGTDIAKGIESARVLLSDQKLSQKVIVLLSDGEDHQDGLETQISALKKEGIKLIVLGVGTPEGGTIPVVENGVESLKVDQNGETVLSKIQEKTLSELAEKTDGVYALSQSLNQSIDLILSTVQKMDAKSQDTKDTLNLKHNYQPFVFLAMLLVLVYIFVQEINLPWRKIK
ncbi:MAG: hypothetical protein C4K58_00790 [Flavobacteriaceae bacterium]|nr:MAG: hypothetical protein C4K58_00790 [Flavobacteriaceae bacterium]